MPFDQNGNWIDDTEYDPYGSGSSGGFTPQQLAMMQQIISGQQGPQLGFDTAGLDPMMGTLFGTAAMPQMDTKGRVQPYDLGVQTQLTNFGQDIGSSIGNNMMSYMAGPGSYAPGAFDPVYDEKPLQLTQQYQLQAMAQSGGVRGTIADLIMGGMNAGQAAARVREMLKTPEKFANVITPGEAAAMRSELNTLPADPMNGIAEGPDYNSIGKIADDIYNPYLQEQGLLNQPDVRQNADGQYVQVTASDSPQMEWLKKMGLPDPRAQYDVKFALDNDPNLRTMIDTVASTQSERELMRKEFDDRVKRTRKYRDDDFKNAAADAKEMDKYHSATKQALNEYFGAASRGQVQRPEMPAQAAALQAAALDPEMYNSQGYRRESYEAPPSGAPGWLKNLPGNIVDGATGMGDYASQTLQRISGKPMSRPGSGGPTLPTNIGPLPGATTEPASINGITLNLPNKPVTSDMRQGLNPDGYSMMDQIMGKPMRDVVGANRQRVLDESIPLETRKKINEARRAGLSKTSGEAAFRYMMDIAPTILAARAGRSPRTDAIQQRLAPLYGIGALGQR